MEKIEDIRYQQKLTLSQQSYLESIIGNHFFTTNHNNKINDTGEEDNINTNMLPLSLSNVNRDHCSIIQQRCVPFMQNDYSNLESPNQLNSYSFINEVNHSVYCHSNGNDVYNDCLTSAPIITTNSNSHDHNHQNYHASTSTPRFIHDKLSSTIRKEHQREQDKNRTRTLNVAFCRLRSCLPEIPKDTKLTKIRTLRYAITYIRQLMDLIHQTDSMNSSAMMFDTGLNSLKMVSIIIVG
ncbi:putative dhand [Schistosoma mansoni]|uniref:putative dhand n=1 Tax=Schistosoma mansoni TaxID=6183 RepID=UPI00022DC648|nr:putative dhand [Schistosoma mansoni]|eukprot:XP_018652201.1 putative dhand [Schistosoma mansoni]